MTPQFAPLPARNVVETQAMLSLIFFNLIHNFSWNPNPSTLILSISMRTTLFSPLSLIRSLTLHHHHRRRHYNFIRCFSFHRTSFFRTVPLHNHLSQVLRLYVTAVPLSDYVEQVVGVEENWNFQREAEAEAEAGAFDFDDCFALTDLKYLSSPSLEELSEQWRRSKLAWLCKELPAHKSGTLVRILNGQRKWITQEDATYVAVHCMQIRESEAGFMVYKWMMQQSKFQFDFALATKLADYMGKERKFSKCREIFDDIINQGHVPDESTFHILIIAYLSSAPVQGSLEEACNIYNRMIQLGGYWPRLSLHNSLFKALVSKPGASSKFYLKQAEFIFHNLVTSGLEIHKDIYGGLLWLHSYQDAIDKERIGSLRDEMKRVGIKESREVLVSVLRACSKVGDVEEAETTWVELLHSDGGLTSQAFVYKMEVYAKVEDPMKSLEIFREMQNVLGSISVVAYHKIIEVLSKAQEIELAESLMREFIESDMKPLLPSFIDLMNMFYNLSLHNKLESTFFRCLEKCRPNGTIYNVFLDSLVKIGNLDKAEEIFKQMHINIAIGVDTRSCNAILRGYVSFGDYVKAERIYDLMCQKKYEIEPPLMDKLEFVLSLSRKVVKKPISLKLSKEQRDVLVGLLLGGLRMESDEERRNHAIIFAFRANCDNHSVLKRHIYDQFHEWLNLSSITIDGCEAIPDSFYTISHTYFGFYAEQFWPKGRQMIPKLINRWLSPRVLAYWYMYAGHKASSGDILLKLKGSSEGVEKIVNTLRTKSLDCKVKRKGRDFWIGFQGSNSTWFWKLIEPYILEEFKDLLQVDGKTLENQMLETPGINFDSGSESDDKDSNYSDEDKS